MDGITQVMMNLIGSEVCGAKFNPELYAALSGEEKVELYRLSQKHDLAHIVGNALLNADLLSEGKLKEAYRKEVYTAIYRYENLNYELARLKETLIEAQIPFIPLKGSVIRDFYPEPWMRTSCDIDILVREEDLLRATEILQNDKGYELKVKAYHDYSLYSPTGIHLELHFNIKENRDSIDKVLVKVWENAAPKAENSYEYLMSNEFFMFHQLAHASYHFVGGGCGIRPFIDIFLLEKHLKYDREKLDFLLTEGKIKTFSESFCKLANVWFGGEEHTELTKKMETYLLSGGVYGTSENHIAMEQSQNKGKARNIFKRIWMPYKNLVVVYPELKGKRILQPFYEIKRWFKLFKKETFQKSVRELKTNTQMSQDKVFETSSLLNELEL